MNLENIVFYDSFENIYCLFNYSHNIRKTVTFYGQAFYTNLTFITKVGL
jgi:hypothetical protein